MTDKDRVIDAAIRFVDAHKFYAETLPHRRKLCTRISQEFGPSCYVTAMDNARANGVELLDEDTEDWCENCQYNRRMALARGERAAKRNGALMRLVHAVEGVSSGE
jgi:thiol:disulfide interchange protein